MYPISKALSALTSLLPPTHPPFLVCRDSRPLWTAGHLHHWMAPLGPAYMVCLCGVPAWTQRMRQVTAGTDPLGYRGQSAHSGVFGPKTSLLLSPLVHALPGAWHAGGDIRCKSLWAWPLLCGLLEGDYSELLGNNPGDVGIYRQQI